MVVESAALYKIFINHASTPRHQRIRGEKKTQLTKSRKNSAMLYIFLKKKNSRNWIESKLIKAYLHFFVVECGSQILAKKNKVRL